MKLTTRVSNDPGALMFYCPGCEMHHMVFTGTNFEGPIWTYNEDPECPTLSPSVLIHMPGNKGLCHLFVRNGYLHYLRDCSHKLAGQIIEMVDLDSLAGPSDTDKPVP